MGIVNVNIKQAAYYFTGRCSPSYSTPAWKKRSPHTKIYSKVEKMHTGIYSPTTNLLSCIKEEKEPQNIEEAFKEAIIAIIIILLVDRRK